MFRQCYPTMLGECEGACTVTVLYHRPTGAIGDASSRVTRPPRSQYHPLLHVVLLPVETRPQFFERANEINACLRI